MKVKTKQKNNTFMKIVEIIKIFFSPKRQIHKNEKDNENKDIYPLW